MSLRSVHHLVSIAAFTLAGLLPFNSFAAVAPRIQGKIDSSSRVAIAKNVHPNALAAQDTGVAAGDLQMGTMTLAFNMTTSQQAALQQLLVNLQNPSSPQYHQWLTPAQFGAQFGLAPADMSAAASWLSAQGFTAVSPAPGGNMIQFTGTAAQVAAAFGTSVHQLSLNGESHYGVLQDPSLPTALASVVTGVSGLDDFRLKPRNHQQIVAAPTGKPDFTSAISGNHFLAPGDIYTIYDENALLSSGINGSGITIAIAGQADLNVADVSAFRSASGLSTTNLPTIRLIGPNPLNTQTSGDLSESSLDAEWAGAIAPNASILFVTSQNVLSTSLTAIIQQNLAPIVAISYGACEAANSVASLQMLNTLFMQANAQGQTIVGPAGDAGATDCEPAQTGATSATTGLAVDFPASSPYVTGVGGTQFNAGTGTYFSATNGAFSGSALSYIPEQVWNESTTVFSSGGGGASSLYTKPSWQIGSGVPNDFTRDVPDVALDASAGTDPYLICSQGSCTNGFRDINSNLNAVGGTSVATPEFAALLALVEQKIGGRIGNANPTLYALAGSTFYNNVFHDTVSGSNAQPCTAGTLNCPNGGTIGYNATPGYDLASGWGSVDAFNLVNDWPLVTPVGLVSTTGTATATTTVTAATPSVPVGTALNVTAAISGPSGSPTGTVQFLIDGTASGPLVPLSGANATAALSTTGLVSGPHTVSARYSGDGVYAGSIGTLLTDVVSTTLPDFTLTPAQVSVATRSGSTAAPIPFTVTALQGFAGTINFTATSNSFNGSYQFSVTPLTLSSTTTTGTTNLIFSAYTTNGSVTGAQRLGGGQASNLPSGKLPWSAPVGGITLASMLLLTLPASKRRRFGALVALICSVGVLATAGCGSSSTAANSANSQTNTAPGTYTVTVTAIGTSAATGATLRHSANVTLTVQ